MGAGIIEPMSSGAKNLLEQALDLDPSERATLAGELIESLEGPPDKDVEAAWLAEIERRSAELDSGAVTLVPWEEVRARLLGRDGASR